MTTTAGDIIGPDLLRCTQLTVTLRVRRMGELRLRVWLAARLLGLAAWVLRMPLEIGYQFETQSGRE